MGRGLYILTLIIMCPTVQSTNLPYFLWPSCWRGIISSAGSNKSSAKENAQTHQCIKSAQSKQGSKVFVQNYKNHTKLRFKKSQYQICYPKNQIHPSKSKFFSHDDLGSFVPRVWLSKISLLFNVQCPGLKRRWRTQITNMRFDEEVLN